MLIVRHRSGPLVGSEQQVEARERDRVVFGRDPNACDVVFPPDVTHVSRRHFALVRKPSGDWTVDLFGQPYVAVNGEPADPAAALKSGSVVQLGGDDGPTFEVTFAPEGLHTSSLPKTIAQKMVPGSRAAAAQAERAAMRARRLALAGVAVAAVAVCAVAGVLYWQGRADRQFAEDLRALRERQDRLAAESIPREHRRRIAQAAYHVVIRDARGRETWAGTSFPIAPNMLATNAHVAIQREQVAGAKLFVRSPGANSRSWEVVDHKLHPAYLPLETFLREDPLFVETIKNEENPWGAQFFTAGNSYDVALMRVEGPPLESILEIASLDDIMKLSAGDPLAYAGYPSQHIIGSEVQRMGPTPQVRTGLVTAMTDLFTMPTEPAYRRLIHHNLGTTAGTSGSPIISLTGRVVALHNRSTYATGGAGEHIPIAVVAYAQRADLLLDLISGRAQTTLDAERAYWAKQTATMRRGVEVIIPAVLDGYRPHPNASATVANRGTFTLAAADRAKVPGAAGEAEQRRRKQHAFQVRAGSSHVFLAYARKAAAIRLYVMEGGRVVAQQEAGKWYPALPHQASSDGIVQVAVVGPDEDVTYTLTDYVWDAPRS